MLERIFNRIKHGKVYTSDSPDDVCAICLENWTNAGPHGLASLSCGHLFGYKCIYEWLTGNDRCPECNATSNRKDIRPIRARNLKALDNSNEEGLKREIKDLKNKIKIIEEKNTKLKSQNQVLSIVSKYSQ